MKETSTFDQYIKRQRMRERPITINKEKYYWFNFIPGRQLVEKAARRLRAHGYSVIIGDPYRSYYDNKLLYNLHTRPKLKIRHLYLLAKWQRRPK